MGYTQTAGYRVNLSPCCGGFMKNIIISGAGEVGRYTAEVLQKRGHSITVIDTSFQALKRLDNVLDARLLQGSACHGDVLEDAGVQDCDVFIAATNLDEINFLTAAIAKKMGADKVIARIHHKTFHRNDNVNYGEVFGIDSLICPEELTARAICAKLHDPGVAAVQRFAGEEIELHQFIVRHDSSAFHKPLKDLKLPPGTRIIIIRRGEQFVVPDKETVLARGDIVTMVGPTKGYGDVKKMFEPHKKEHYEIVISGASATAEWILNEIDRRLYSIRLFEGNLERAEDFATRYPEITVLNADPNESHVFEAEYLSEVSGFISAGDSEEFNILGSLQAKKNGVGTTFAVIHNSSHLSSLDGIGIDYPFSPRMEGAKELLRLIDDSSIKILASLEKGHVYVYELQVAKGAAGAGKSLHEINFPRATIVAAIQREKKVIAPTPADVIEEGDQLIIMGPETMEKTLRKLFIQKKLWKN